MQDQTAELVGDEPVPGGAPPDASHQWPAQRLTVDVEIFDVQMNSGNPGSTRYKWISGPNPGYGFGSASNGRHPWTRDDHEQAIRRFPAMIDLDTGYIADGATTTD